jgi:hypothetical protein
VVHVTLKPSNAYKTSSSSPIFFFIMYLPINRFLQKERVNADGVRLKPHTEVVMCFFSALLPGPKTQVAHIHVWWRDLFFSLYSSQEHEIECRLPSQNTKNSHHFCLCICSAHTKKLMQPLHGFFVPGQPVYIPLRRLSSLYYFLFYPGSTPKKRQ